MQKHPKGTMAKKNTAKFEISVYFYGNDNENLNLTKLSQSSIKTAASNITKNRISI